ncbi:hypothetical protein MKW94_023377 [Papaver nudicaule]|uniref:Uncharacterized protein n=1 Tax=Papaver nudicaule TaxID=74823 RepID=A0AA41SNB9_PAPNU|nr:hypothetical protein [Papaver nudicaule]
MSAYIVSFKNQASETPSNTVKMHRNNNHAEEDHEEQDDQSETANPIISSHLYLKPTHTSQSLDKDVVLRRIRQRRRVTKVRNAFQAFLTFPKFSSKTAAATDTDANKDNASSTHHQVKWLDDAFAAP